MRGRRLDWWLTAAVLVHLLITFAHGSAHDGGGVALTTGQSAFVFIVILAGPIAGLIASYFTMRIGGWIVAATMCAALIFGVVNHFVIVSPDHVSQVPSAWRSLFTTTAWLLIGSEALGTAAGLRVALESRRVGP
jgi:hypothetical protein